MKRKVLIIGPTNIDGGIGHIVMDTCRNMDLSHIHLDFMDYVAVKDEERKIIESFGGSFYLVPRYSRHPLMYLKWITNFYKKHSYDIVHCNASTAMPIMYTLPLWFNRKTKIIYQSHSNFSDSRYLHYIMRKIVKWRADLCIGVSERAGVWMFGKAIVKSSRFKVLKNGISVSDFLYDENIRKRVRDSWGVNDNNYVIGHVGRFSEEKNHTFIIDVFEKIVLKDVDARLVLVGDGPLRSKIEADVCRRGLEQKVLFVGNTTHVSKILQAMDLFLFPSKWEGLGIVAIEAQAAGLPVVASKEIPEEAKILESFYYMSLQDSDIVWAERIGSIMSVGKMRVNTNSEITDAGYNIKYTARKLQDLYENF